MIAQNTYNVGHPEEIPNVLWHWRLSHIRVAVVRDRVTKTVSDDLRLSRTKRPKMIERLSVTTQPVRIVCVVPLGPPSDVGVVSRLKGGL